MSYLDEHVDPALKIDPDLTRAQIEQAEAERLLDLAVVAHVASEIPRRLADATAGELAQDKRRSRRIKHALIQSLQGWQDLPTTEVYPASPEQASRGAVVNWEEWWREHEAWLVARRRYIATWAKTTGELRFGKTAVVRLSNECEWLRYAMR